MATRPLSVRELPAAIAAVANASVDDQGSARATHRPATSIPSHTHLCPRFHHFLFCPLQIEHFT